MNCFNIRKSLAAKSRDIEQVLERKPKDMEVTRRVRSKEWILQLKNLIDLDPTRSLCDLAKEMGCSNTTVGDSNTET